MAKVDINQLMAVLQGSIGDLVFRPRPDGSIVVSRAPHHNKARASAKQKAHRQRFKEATRYARWAADVHPVYGELAAGTWKSAYNFALADWFHAPVIHSIERAAGCIRVQVTDNIMVARVRVSLRDEAGALLERGEAVRAEGDWWEFPSASAAGTITAEAWDLADNKTTSPRSET